MKRYLLLVICLIVLLFNFSPALAQTYTEDFSTTTYKDPASTACWDTVNKELRLSLNTTFEIIGQIDTSTADACAGHVFMRTLTKDSNGNLYLLYNPYNVQKGPIYLTRSTDHGKTWTPKWKTVAGPPDYYSGFGNASLAIDSNNLVHIVFSATTAAYPTHEQEWHCTYNPANDQFSSIIHVPSALSRWIGGTEYKFKHLEPSLAIDENNNLHLAYWGFYYDGGSASDRAVQYQKREAATGTWGAAQIIDEDSAICHDIAIAAASSNRIYLFWSRNVGGTDYGWYAYYNGTIWSTPEGIPSGNGEQAYRARKSLAADSLGNAHAVWANPALNVIRYSRYTPGSGWSTPITVIPNYGSASIGVAKNNNLYVSCKASVFPQYLFWTIYNGTTWEAVQQDTTGDYQHHYRFGRYPSWMASEPVDATLIRGGGPYTIYFTSFRYLTSGEALSAKVNSSGKIEKATLTANHNLGSGSIQYYLSNNEWALSWEAVTPGVEHRFSSAGADLRWRAVFSSSDPDKISTPTLTSLSINYQGENPVISAKIDGKVIRDNDYISARPLIEGTITDPGSVEVSSLRLTIDTTVAIYTDLSPVPSTDAQAINISYQPTTALTAGDHTIKIEGSDLADNWSTWEAKVKVKSEVGIEGPTLNYPNPFKPAKGIGTTICYMLTGSGANEVTIYIFDTKGAQVWKRTFTQYPGYQQVYFDGINDFGEYLGNGVYIYQIVVGGKLVGKGKMAVLE